MENKSLSKFATWWENQQKELKLKTFSIIDEEGWRKDVEVNKDCKYGRGVIVFVASWANLMEKKMKEGSKLIDIAKSSSHEADTEGITGFMYGITVAILSRVWKHGEELRRWHNLDVQIGDEGEETNKSGSTLNPALLNIE